MEVEVYGGLDELFTGAESEIDYFFDTNNTGVLENNIPDVDGVISADFLEQGSILDDDLDQVLKNFLKTLDQEISDEDISYAKAGKPISVADSLILEFQKALGIDIDDEDTGVEHVDAEMAEAATTLGILMTSAAAGTSSSSSSSSAGPSILLGGVVDITSFQSFASWNSLHGGTFQQPSFSSSSSSPPTQLNALTQGVSSFAGAGGDVIAPSQPDPNLEDMVRDYERLIMDTGSTASGSEPRTLLDMGSTSSGSEPRTRRRKGVRKDIPPGVDVITRVRKNGKSKGHIDTFYIIRETKRRFRSMPELQRFMNTSPPNESEGMSS